jgi:hypothetical protein
MTMEEAASILREMYETAPEGKKVVHIHLFGIRYAEHITDKSLKDLTALAGINESYATEIGKGVRLAEYVQLRL